MDVQKTIATLTAAANKVAEISAQKDVVEAQLKQLRTDYETKRADALLTGGTVPPEPEPLKRAQETLADLERMLPAVSTRLDQMRQKARSDAWLELGERITEMHLKYLNGTTVAYRLMIAAVERLAEVVGGTYALSAISNTSNDGVEIRKHLPPDLEQREGITAELQRLEDAQRRFEKFNNPEQVIGLLRDVERWLSRPEIKTNATATAEAAGVTINTKPATAGTERNS